jgi:hypothetical protein
LIFCSLHKEKKLNKLQIILAGQQSSGSAVVYGKRRTVVPFIGIIEHDDGSHERGIGVKCPNQGKLIFRAINSADPLHHLRALKMLSELDEITDSLVQDCIIATQEGSRLKNFSQTTVFEKCGAHRQAKFLDVQVLVLAFEISPDDIKKVVNGFAAHLVPLGNVARSDSVASLGKSEKLAAARERPCFLPLVHALGSSTQSMSPAAV